jgi:hypothetical protein
MAVADCCGTLTQHIEDDGYDVVLVGRVLVCGHCLIEAGVEKEEPE